MMRCILGITFIFISTCLQGLSVDFENACPKQEFQRLNVSPDLATNLVQIFKPKFYIC